MNIRSRLSSILLPALAGVALLLSGCAQQRELGWCTVAGAGIGALVGTGAGFGIGEAAEGNSGYNSRVTAGAIWDVAVDLRRSSPSFGRWAAVQLDDRARRAVFLGDGLGHAFAARSEEATVMYLCSTSYDPARERGIDPLDPELAIAWPGDVEPILSDKDAGAPSLAQARAAGLLPDYADCLAHAARLRGS